MKLPQRFSDERSEAGETLLEVLMSSALMAIVVVGIVGGIAMVLLGAFVHREQTDANSALVAAMEQLKSTDTARACTYTGLPANVTLKSIEYQVNKVTTSGLSVDFDGTVTCDLTSALTLQRITLQYTSTDGRVAPELTFVKGEF